MSHKMPLRTIVVQGATFHWKADWVYVEGIRTVRLRVWGGDKTSRQLHAHLIATFHTFRARVARGEIEVGWLNYLYALDTAYVQPRDVRAIIEYALGHGWDPHTSGTPFCLGASDPSPSEELALVDIR
jgi:hypothetical protein